MYLCGQQKWRWQVRSGSGHMPVTRVEMTHLSPGIQHFVRYNLILLDFSFLPTNNHSSNSSIEVINKSKSNSFLQFVSVKFETDSFLSSLSFLVFYQCKIYYYKINCTFCIISIKLHVRVLKHNETPISQ